MMSIKEAKEILKGIAVTEENIEKAEEAMLDKIHNWKANGMYRKQGGVPFKFNNGHMAWITVWTFGGDQYYDLTERGETLYIGCDKTECAKTLYKVGVAHRMMNNFLDCAK